MKTDVTFAKISIGFNKTVIEDFKLKNIKKNESKYAFTAKKIEIDYSFQKLFSDPTVIESIAVNDIHLAINCHNPLCSSNNWIDIVSKIKEKESTKKTKDFLIENLYLNKMNVEITGLGIDFADKKTKYISNLEFRNIGSKAGFPTSELIAAIFGSAGLMDYIKSVLNPKGIIKNVFEGIKILGSNDVSSENQLNTEVIY